MNKKAFYFMIIAGLCFGQSIESGSDPKVREEAFNKNLSLEIFGGKYFTFDHEMEFSATTLPFYMWKGGGAIIYQPIPNISFSLISLTGSYSYTKDVYCIHNELFLPPELKFSVNNVSFVVSFKNSSSKNVGYFIGSGIDISFIKLFYNSNSPISNDTTLNTTYLRPLVRGGLWLNIISPLYIKIQIESEFYHFAKIGSKHINLGRISPSICIGLGYTFNLGRRGL
jgi:hypothetical protein